MLLSIGAAVIGAMLYRLRGGWWRDLFGDHWWTGAQAMRLIWSLPTGILLTFATGAPPWVAFVAVITVFLSMALIGHGAHMVMDPEEFVIKSANKTELLTEWWLPKLFGGVPDQTWLPDRSDSVVTYNVVGMGFIGLVRNLLAALPLLWFAPVFAIAYAATGAIHGLWYYAGWRLDGRSQAGEAFVGAASWLVIVGGYAWF